MGLITKTVKLQWSNSNKQWYVSKGYLFTKMRDEFEVKVEDLSFGSHLKVDAECDGCGKKSKVIWKHYKKYNKVYGSYYCLKCGHKIYGIENMTKTKLKNSKSFEQWCIENNRQDILDRWDYELNKIRPSEICYSTNKKFYFKCSNGIHESELKDVCSYVCGEYGVIECVKCNSFAQWGIDNICSDFLEKYWDFKKNRIDPWKNRYKSKKKIWIKCQEKNYHESYDMTCYDFTTDQRCPYCSHRGNKIHVLDSFSQWGINNICKDFLEKYWDHEKNLILPWKLSPNNSTKVWIKCQEKDYHGSYLVSCSNFIYGNRCPYCRNIKIHLVDSLGKVLEDRNLMLLWSDKNIKSPYEYAPYSGQKVWWNCDNNIHEDYERMINESNRCDFKCPKCIHERTESFLQEKVRIYLEDMGYVILHENKCTIIPKNPRTKKNLPFDNEIKELKLIIEVHGKQHYNLNTVWIDKSLSKNNYTREETLHYQQLKDRYKRMYAKSRGYDYLEIPYWTDNEQEEWRHLINEKIKEVISKIA